MDSLKKFHRKAFNIITFTGFPVILFFLWLQLTERTNTIFNTWASIISGIIFLISAIICFLYYKKLGDKGGISLTILCTGIANLLFFLGSVSWFYDNFFLGIEILYPSLADAFFILMPIMYSVAVGALLQIYRSSTKPSTWFIGIAVFAILAYIMFITVGKPEISNELTFWENFFNFAYSISNSIYVGTGISLLIIAGGKIYKGILVWVLAMFLIAAADQIFTYRAATEIIWNGDISDQLYTLSAIIFTYSIILLAKMSEEKKIVI